MDRPAPPARHTKASALEPMHKQDTRFLCENVPVQLVFAEQGVSLEQKLLQYLRSLGR